MDRPGRKDTPRRRPRTAEGNPKPTEERAGEEGSRRETQTPSMDSQTDETRWIHIQSKAKDNSFLRGVANARNCLPNRT